MSSELVGDRPHDAWPADLEARVERMWRRDGLSASEIAVALGGALTRHAILAGANRRWGARGDSRESQALASRLARGLAPAPRKLWGVKAANHAPGPRACTLADKPARGCSWWVGEDRTDDGQLFCGEEREPLSPYCRGHGRLR